MFGDNTVKALDDGFAFSSVFQSEKGAMSSGGTASRGTGEQLKCKIEGISYLPLLSLSFLLSLGPSRKLSYLRS